MHRRAFTIAAAALLAACAMDKVKTKETILDETLRTYAATIRWGDVAQAEVFIDSEYRAKHPLTELDVQRFKQVQVTTYNDQPATPVSDTEVQQVVEIGLVNVNTQTARSIVDRQVWKYDEKQKRWWLTTGLPDITRKN